MNNNSTDQHIELAAGRAGKDDLPPALGCSSNARDTCRVVAWVPQHAPARDGDHVDGFRLLLLMS